MLTQRRRPIGWHTARRLLVPRPRDDAPPVDGSDRTAFYVESPLERIVDVYWPEEVVHLMPGDITFNMGASSGFALSGADPISGWIPVGNIAGISGQPGSCIHAAEGSYLIGISDGATTCSISGTITAQASGPQDPNGSSGSGWVRCVELFPNADNVLFEGGGATWSGTSSGAMGQAGFAGSFNADRGRQGMAITFQFSAHHEGGKFSTTWVYCAPEKVSMHVSVRSVP